jgi:hypothetical protein
LGFRGLGAVPLQQLCCAAEVVSLLMELTDAGGWDFERWGFGG